MPEELTSRTYFFYSKIKEAIIITCRYITYEDRKHLEQLYSAGAAISDIAVTLNIHISTAYREIAKGNTGTLDENGRFGYDAEIAQKATQESLKRRGGKRTKKKRAKTKTVTKSFTVQQKVA